MIRVEFRLHHRILELVKTEEKYVSDLETVVKVRDK